MEDFKFEKAREAIEDLDDEQRDALLFLLLTDGQANPGDELQIELVYQHEGEMPLEARIPDALPVDFGEEYFGENAHQWAETLHSKISRLDGSPAEEIQAFASLLRGALGLFQHEKLDRESALKFFDAIRSIWHDCISHDSKKRILAPPESPEMDPEVEDIC